ncbi:unnamed protein product [Acanthoscelides obtectus]|uniref:Transposase n=1 Tax=Acanthoscelides obtectus TaxID=200917 RepID=A0A9P0VQ48_ACAOB|nr:unnamed protein product [Acanthoscelides obtectus]CAK1686445.1 Histone-lysine N-methyltransferase SETMAR [Acanthoscelides obtectus]
MELNREQFRAIIYYNFQRQLLQQEYLTDLSDDPRVGAPKTALTQENVDVVRKLIIEDRHVTYREIEASLKISKTSIQKIGDESGIYCYEPENKRQSAVWSRYLCQKRLRKVNPERRIILHQDNASSHTAQKTRQYLTEENVELLEHPPYSPDQSPNVFFTFPKIKNRLRGQRFQSPEEAVDAFKNAVLDLPANEWNKCFENWFERMHVAAEIFNERHENSNVHRKYDLELVAKFRETGSVANKKRKIENPIRNEAIGVGVLGQVYVDPTLSTRKLETVCGVSRVINENRNDRRYIANRLLIQQDGAPPHYALRVRQYLDQTFPDRWIGRRGAIEWSPRSPDLSTLDFFMCGHLKSKIYATQPTSLEDLRQRIANECLRITPQVLQNQYVQCSHYSEFLSVTKYYFQRQLSQQECLAELLSVFGNEVPHQSTISRWYGEFKRGQVSLSDDPRVGAPKTAVTQENVDAVRKLIIEDRRVTYREIEASLKISKTSIQKILHEELGVRKLVSRWIPHLLTEEQKAARVNWCQKTIDRFNSGNTKTVYSIVSGDESWIYCYEPENKRQSAVWPTKVIRSRSGSKKMVATKAGHIATIPVNEQRTVIADWYTSICLPKVITELRKINPERRIILHQDNAGSHTAQKTRQYLTGENVQLLDHPPYSPDRSPNDFFTFPKIKNRLRGQRFQSPEEAVDAFKNAVLNLPDLTDANTQLRSTHLSALIWGHLALISISHSRTY